MHEQEQSEDNRSTTNIFKIDKKAQKPASRPQRQELLFPAANQGEIMRSKGAFFKIANQPRENGKIKVSRPRLGNLKETEAEIALRNRIILEPIQKKLLSKSKDLSNNFKVQELANIYRN